METEIAMSELSIMLNTQELPPIRLAIQEFCTMKDVSDRTYYYWFRLPRQCTHSDLISSSQVRTAVISVLLEYELKQNKGEVIS
jgi:hypothetical protein